MLKIILIVGGVVFSLFSAITFYACCIVAGRADWLVESSFYNNKNGNVQNRK
ncbi:hypothetical protein [Enterococcus gallinarum]|uniref:hypothetical protein n=1 Tax=Enterococcus gallinarum TaxID=1353 RepID=UPI00214C6674|nr:hypothetical protein [Enterococcus gallinarum]MCR1929451.1 hypothetical protein [Enterococcus gallinarum]MCR1932322.1 hypothetical protein [Enterococcus gallinarum]